MKTVKAIKATTLTKSQISFAMEMYQEHGYSIDHIAFELEAKPTTVTRYLEANGVTIAERDPQLAQFRTIMIEAFKTLDHDFVDLEIRNYGFILNLFNEAKNG